MRQSRRLGASWPRERCDLFWGLGFHSGMSLSLELFDCRHPCLGRLASLAYDCLAAVYIDLMSRRVESHPLHHSSVATRCAHWWLLLRSRWLGHGETQSCTQQCAAWQAWWPACSAWAAAL